MNEVRFVDLEGNATTLIDDLNNYQDVKRSPDGQRLALTVETPGGERQIQVYDVGAESTPITFEGRP